ncbi:YlxR family protein [Paraconexibacter antarcticus]|uniref:YlxR family protein n=1 Tax=Paraconexibacter antarcticus TaxID=2949664 RepID=UPI00345F3EBD
MVHPTRRCIGCGALRPKAELLRLAVAGDEVVQDPRAIMPGRGAYVCDRACWEQALRRRAVPRAFRRNVSIDPSLLDLTS